MKESIVERLINNDDQLIEILKSPKTIENLNERRRLLNYREILIHEYREKRRYQVRDVIDDELYDEVQTYEDAQRLADEIKGLYISEIIKP